MAKHTPGRLKVEHIRRGGDANTFLPVIVNAHGDILFTVKLPTFDRAQSMADARRLAAAWNACENLNPEAVPDLLAACHCEANDTMDGDLLSIVASWLLTHADAVDAATNSKCAHVPMVREWASRLLRKQRLQHAAIAQAQDQD